MLPNFTYYSEYKLEPINIYVIGDTHNKIKENYQDKVYDYFKDKSNILFMVESEISITNNSLGFIYNRLHKLKNLQYFILNQKDYESFHKIISPNRDKPYDYYPNLHIFINHFLPFYKNIEVYHENDKKIISSITEELPKNISYQPINIRDSIPCFCNEFFFISKYLFYYLMYKNCYYESEFIKSKIISDFKKDNFIYNIQQNFNYFKSYKDIYNFYYDKFYDCPEYKKLLNEEICYKMIEIYKEYCLNDKFLNIKDFDTLIEYFDFITEKLPMFENGNCALFRCVADIMIKIFNFNTLFYFEKQITEIQEKIGEFFMLLLQTEVYNYHTIESPIYNIFDMFQQDFYMFIKLEELYKKYDNIVMFIGDDHSLLLKHWMTINN